MLNNQMISLMPFMTVYTIVMWILYWYLAARIWRSDITCVKAIWSIWGAIVLAWMAIFGFQTIIASVTDGHVYFEWYLSEYRNIHVRVNTVGGCVIMFIYAGYQLILSIKELNVSQK